MRFQTKRSNQHSANTDRIVQGIPPMPRVERNFTDPRQLPGMDRLTASDGLTIVMAPVRYIPGVDSMPTQQLPPIVEDLPPSARHVDPVKGWERLHVEDNDLEPETPGRHAMDELMAAPDDIRELAVVAQRVIDDLGGPDTVVKDPARRASVRAFRHARDMQRAREARAAAAISSADKTLRGIRSMWNDWDGLLRDWNAALCGQEAVNAGYSLAAAYEENRQRVAEENVRRAAEGQPPLDATATTFTRGMVADLQQLIVQRATAGSAVSQ